MTQQKLSPPAILYQLMNAEYNRELLAKIPHIPYLDMAIVFYYWKKGEDGADEKETAHIVSYEEMDRWRFTLESMETLAAYNTPRSMPVSFCSIEEAIAKIFEEEPPKLSRREEKGISMHILTNKEKLFGAAAMLYPQVLWAISSSFQDDLYVLPSSIHECIIIPASVNCSQKQLESVVSEINMTQVPRKEILSNRVFFYQKKEDKLSI